MRPRYSKSRHGQQSRLTNFKRVCLGGCTPFIELSDWVPTGVYVCVHACAFLGICACGCACVCAPVFLGMCVWLCVHAHVGVRVVSDVLCGRACR